MREKTLFTVCRSTLLSVAVVCALIFSFGIHSVEMTHVHPGHAHVDGTSHPSEVEKILSLNEYIHANEQKLFMFILMSVLILGCLYLPSFLQVSSTTLRSLAQLCASHRVRMRQDWSRSRYKIYYLVYLFSNGILHPKLY